MTHLKAGDPTPTFSGVDQHGNVINNDTLKGKKTIFYFYPKDDTPGCTAEACAFRDAYQDLQDHGFQVIGVSADSLKKHNKFADKYQLPFSLIADEDRSVINAFGVWGLKKFMGREFDGIHRETFVIGENGIIEHVINKVNTKQAAEQILELYK